MVHRFIPAVVAVVLVGPLVWWSFDDTAPVVVHSSRVVSEKTARGGAFIMEYDLTYTRLCAGEAQRYFVDATETVLPIEPYRFLPGTGRDNRTIPLGQRQTLRVSATVPFGASPGPAKYQVVTEFFCNPLQQALRRGILFAFPVQMFEVAEGNPQVPPANSPPRPAFTDPLRNMLPPFTNPMVIPNGHP